jgi:hypothetical protein
MDNHDLFNMAMLERMIGKTDWWAMTKNLFALLAVIVWSVGVTIASVTVLVSQTIPKFPEHAFSTAMITLGVAIVGLFFMPFILFKAFSIRRDKND